MAAAEAENVAPIDMLPCNSQAQLLAIPLLSFKRQSKEAISGDSSERSETFSLEFRLFFSQFLAASAFIKRAVRKNRLWEAKDFQDSLIWFQRQSWDFFDLILAINFFFFFFRFQDKRWKIKERAPSLGILGGHSSTFSFVSLHILLGFF